MTLGDACHALDHADDALPDDDESKQLQAFDNMRVLEADDAPCHGDEKNSQTFDYGNDDPTSTC